jgi:hypothetical protein
MQLAAGSRNRFRCYVPFRAAPVLSPPEREFRVCIDHQSAVCPTAMHLLHQRTCMELQ